MFNNKIAQLSNPYNSKRRFGGKGKERASHYHVKIGIMYPRNN
jgi:hypothetical protein